MQVNLETATLVPAQSAGWQDYLTLCKPRIVAMIVFTAVVGMFLAVPGGVPASLLLAAGMGIALAAAASAVVNHIADWRIDSVMARTRGRPLPQGRVSVPAAVRFAFLLGVLSMIVLSFFVNSLTAVLTLVSLIGYGFVYSSYLKRATPQNIVIGGAAGAAPPVLGWTAVTGNVDSHALLLFLIVFAWTPPHFWSLALYRCREYAHAGIPMLPVTHGDRYTRLHILLYTVITVIASLLPALTWMSGRFYLLAALLLGGRFLYLAWHMQVDRRPALAQKVFSWSIHYLMLLFAALLIDHYLPWPLGAASP